MDYIFFKTPLESDIPEDIIIDELVITDVFRYVRVVQGDAFPQSWIKTSEKEFYAAKDMVFPPLPVREPLPFASNQDLIHSNMHLAAMLDIFMKAQNIPALNVDTRLFEAVSDIDKQEIQRIAIASASSTQSPRYEFWRYAYFHNHTNLCTLETLVSGGIITQEEKNSIVNDRAAEFGV